VSEATIKTAEPVTVAFKVMHGPYAQMAEGMGALYAWVEHYGLVPTGMPAAIYLTVPSVTPEAEAEWEIWAPIAGGAGDTAPDDQGFGVKRIEAETVASAIHKGPYEELAEAYAALVTWVAEQGYQIVGPPREFYHSDPAEVPPEEYLTEIQLPVARA
jgi:effector-binding domain-containing protein